MTREEIKEIVINIISDILPDTDCSNINPETKLQEQLGLDSMDFLDIILELKMKYRIEVTEANYENLITLNSCLDFLEPLLKNSSNIK